MIEKVARALIHASRRLQPYFQSHEIIVRTDYPISKVLRKFELAGRMIGWSVELLEFIIKYTARSALPRSCKMEAPWILYVDRSSNKGGGGARVVLEGSGTLRI